MGKFLFFPPPILFPFFSVSHIFLLFPSTGIPTVAPPTARPTPRRDVTPPSMGTFLLYAQGQQIGHLPLNGTRLQKDAAKTLLSLHVKWISPVGVQRHEACRSGQGLEVEGGPGGFLGCRLSIRACHQHSTKSGSLLPGHIWLTKAAFSVWFIGFQICGKGISELSGYGGGMVIQGKTDS